MFCSKCGSALTPNTAFCQVCGTPVQPVAPMAASSSYPPHPAYPAAATAGTPGQVSPHWLPAPTRTFAGFWIRFVAFIIDSIVVSIVTWIFILPLSAFTGLGAVLRGIHPDREPDPAMFIALLSAVPLLAGVSIIIRWLYFAYCESCEWQATLGKKALNLIVTDLQGNRISFGRASGRFFAKILSGLILLIGFIMAGFTQKKQALHDILADTLVLRS